MKIAVLANERQLEELKPVIPDNEWHIFSKALDFFGYRDASIYINLMDDAAEKDYSMIKAPVLINAVILTLKEIDATENILRFNGWTGFIQRANWEIAGKMNKTITDFFLIIKKEYTVVKDEPGFIAARIIAMIINEAWFALGENISTKEEINLAMRLGTNYPYGPFEWTDKIGVKNICSLLKKLSLNDPKYLPATLLKQNANK